MKAETPAKINLFLELGRVRKNGYHEISSLVEPLSLCDILTFEPRSEVRVRFDSPWPVDPLDNTVTRAVEALRRCCGRTPGVGIRVRKHIPAAAGMGGGSSDAACVLRVLNARWRLRLDAGSLRAIAASIGSDVPLFLRPGRCLIGGVGERIRPAPRCGRLWYFLAVPDFPVATADVYRCYDRFFGDGRLTEAAGKIKILCAATVARNIAVMEATMFNRLERAAEKLCGEIKEVREHLHARSGKKFMLSGSGGTLFSVFAEREGAERMARTFRIRGWRGLVAESWAARR